MRKKIIVTNLGLMAAILLVTLMILPIMSTGSRVTPITAASPATVNLGTAENFVILTKSGISTTGVTEIKGNLGASPVGSVGITGFSLVLSDNGQYATSTLVDGKIYASNYADPTPAMLSTAILDMEAAYTDASGRTGATALGASGEIGGLTLATGIYNYAGSITLTGEVVLDGSSSDVWIFQMSGDFTVAPDAKVTLTGGAEAKNIFWAVAGVASLEAGSTVNGVILCSTEIALENGAVLNGRALSQTAVSLIANSVQMPGAITTDPNDDDGADDESKVDGYSTLFLCIGLFVSVGIIARLKRRSV
jgi:hypothetical protein